MRQFIWFKTTGELGGEMLWPGGWPPEIDLTNPADTHPAAVANREFAQAQADYAGIIEYVCACDPGSNDCRCHGDLCGTHRMVGDPPVLTEKVPISVLINGVDVGTPSNTGTTPHFVPAGVDFTLQFAGAFDDGFQFTLQDCAGVPPTLGEDTVMTFTGGLTQELTLAGPSGGVLKGVFARNNTAMRSVRVVVSGA